MPSIQLRDESTDAQSPYGYTPTEWTCIMFIALFSVSTLIHIAQAVRYRLWWLLITAVVAGILEILGWSGRLWSSLNVLLRSPFIMQIVATILAPTPFIAVNFIILGQVIRRLGQNYSRLSAKWYSIVFVSSDLVSLVVQAVGGAQAAGATRLADANMGGNVMLGGIAFQLAAITLYAILAIEYFWRYLSNRPLHESQQITEFVFDAKMQLMVMGLALTSLVIYIRSIYRLIELADGWNGTVIQTQIYFNIFDAGMVTVAMYTLNILHPGLLLGHAETWKEQTKKEMTDEGSFQ